MLLFQLGNGRYAVSVDAVVEVAPQVELGAIAKAPDYTAGLFNYRGQNVPVIDLCRLLLQRPCQDSFTTRIMLVNFVTSNGDSRLLGLLAERITETITINAADFTDTGIDVDDAPYLGRVTRTRHGLVQQVSVNALLPAAVQAHLFQSEAV